MSNGGAEACSCKKSRNGVKEWNGVRERGGNARGGGGGFEAGDASGDVFDEIVTSTEAFRFGRLNGRGGS